MKNEAAEQCVIKTRDGSTICYTVFVDGTVVIHPIKLSDEKNRKLQAGSNDTIIAKSDQHKRKQIIEEAWNLLTNPSS